MDEEKLVYERQNSSKIFGFVQFVTFAISIGVGIYVGSVFGAWWGVLGFILGMIFFYLYFLPTYISEQKDQHQTGAICLTNIFPASWPIALIWALALKSNVPKGYTIVESKGLVDKMNDSIDNIGKNFDKLDKSMDEKIKQIEEDTKLNPQKYEKFNKVSGWIGLIFFIIVAILTIACIVETNLHSSYVENKDFYLQANLQSFTQK